MKNLLLKDLANRVGFTSVPLVKTVGTTGRTFGIPMVPLIKTVGTIGRTVNARNITSGKFV